VVLSRLLSAVMVAAWGLGAPGLALAAQTFSVSSPTGFPAGGDPTYTTRMAFDAAAGAPSRAIVTLAPGVLASLTANPSCLKTLQHTASCHIGDGSASTLIGVPVPVTAYLVPPASSADAAGIDLVSSTATTHAEVQLRQTADGKVSSVLDIDLAGLGAAGSLVTGTSLTVNGTLDGKPFTRMPSNCSPGGSSLTVQYANGTSETTKASPDFAPTGCASLPYSPRLSAALRKDAGDDGVRIVSTVTQAADEAASASNSLRLPFPTVGENLAALSIQCSAAPCGTAAGSVTASSPLLPVPLVGQVYLTGTPLGPTLTLLFPPPNALTLVGTVDLQSGSVTFNHLPDVPQTSLVVTLFGGPHALEIATCSPPDGIASGTFTAQSGRVVTDTEHVFVSGCPPPRPPRPAIRSATLSGLAAGRPALALKVVKAPTGPTLASVALTLPRGLRFNPRGLGRGLSLRGLKSVRLRGATLTVVLRHPAAVIALRVSAPLLVAARPLAKRPLLRVRVIDASGRSTTLTARLSPR
jgi:hypothetical protein